jgi:hypothetical protein
VLLRKQNAVLGCIYGTPKTKNKSCSYRSFTDTDLVVIMGGVTLQLQVLDMVNKPFKDHLKQLYSEWLVTRYHTLNPVGRIKNHVVIPVCQWLFRAWQCISPAAFVEACKQCCISNELDWTDGDTLWNESKEKGVLAVGVKKVKALTVRMETLQTVKMERVTLIGKGRISHVFYTNCMKLTANCFS